MRAWFDVNTSVWFRNIPFGFHAYVMVETDFLFVVQDEEIENEHTNKIQIGLGLKFEQDFTELNPGFKGK